MVKNGVPITPFPAFVAETPVIPDLYWDVYSAEQRWKSICAILKQLSSYLEAAGEAINLDRATINQLQQQFNDFINHGFDDYYTAQVAQWINDNLETILNAFAQQLVFFGLTEDGYFTAYVPMRYSFTLDTDINYTSDNYGKLEIIY